MRHRLILAQFGWAVPVSEFCEGFRYMPEGKIKRLTDKGFGFIETGKGQDMFFHSSNVEGDYDSLREGQRVSFTEGRGPKGPRAENVKVVD